MLFAATEIASQGSRSDGRPAPLFLLLLLGLAGFFLVRRQRRGKGMAGGRHRSSPLSHLQLRFASGEIGQAEFEHRRGVLRGDKNIPNAPENMAPPATVEDQGPEPDDEN